MVYIIIVALFSIVVFILNVKTKFLWKIQAYQKWKDVQPDIRQIHSMYSQYCIEGKQVGWFNKNIFKETKSQLWSNVKAWSFDASSNTLTIGTTKLKVQREVDWEAR